MIAERRRGGAYRDIADLAGRSGASRAALVRLAWAGACDRLERLGAPAAAGNGHAAEDSRRVTSEALAAEAMAVADGASRRPALWQAGAASRALAR